MSETQQPQRVWLLLNAMPGDPDQLFQQFPPRGQDEEQAGTLSVRLLLSLSLSLFLSLHPYQHLHLSGIGRVGMGWPGLGGRGERIHPRYPLPPKLAIHSFQGRRDLGTRSCKTIVSCTAGQGIIQPTFGLDGRGVRGYGRNTKPAGVFYKVLTVNFGALARNPSPFFLTVRSSPPIENFLYSPLPFSPRPCRP